MDHLQWKCLCVCGSVGVGVGVGAGGGTVQPWIGWGLNVGWDSAGEPSACTTTHMSSTRKEAQHIARTKGKCLPKALSGGCLRVIEWRPTSRFCA